MATRCSPTSNLESSPEKNEGIHKQIVHYNKCKLGGFIMNSLNWTLWGENCQYVGLGINNDLKKLDIQCNSSTFPIIANKIFITILRIYKKIK